MSNFYGQAQNIAGQLNRTGDIVGRQNAMQYAAQRDLEMATFNRKYAETIAPVMQTIEGLAPEDQLKFFDDKNEETDPTLSWKALSTYDFGIDENDPYANEKRAAIQRGITNLIPWATESKAKANTLYTTNVLGKELPPMPADGKDQDAVALLEVQIKAGTIPYEAGTALLKTAIETRDSSWAMDYARMTDNPEFLLSGRDIELDEVSAADPNITALRDKAAQALARLTPEKREALGKDLVDEIKRDELQFLEERKQGYTAASNEYQTTLYNGIITGDLRLAEQLINSTEEAGLFYEPAYKKQWIDGLDSARRDIERRRESLQSDAGKAELDRFNATSESHLANIAGYQVGAYGPAQEQELKEYLAKYSPYMTFEHIQKARVIVSGLTEYRQVDPAYQQSGDFFKGAKERFEQAAGWIKDEGRGDEIMGWMNSQFQTAWEDIKTNTSQSSWDMARSNLMAQVENLAAANFGITRLTRGNAQINIPNRATVSEQAKLAVSQPVFNNNDRTAWTSIESVAKNGGLAVGIVTGDQASVDLHLQSKTIQEQAIVSTLASTSSSATFRNSLQGQTMETTPDLYEKDGDGLPITSVVPRNPPAGARAFINPSTGAVRMKLKGNTMMVLKNQGGALLWVPLSELDAAMRVNPAANLMNQATGAIRTLQSTTPPSTLTPQSRQLQVNE